MEFSQITDQLFIGTTPRSEAYHRLRNLGVGLVINMRAERPPHRDYNNPPLPVLWLPTFDTPLIPIPLRYLRRGVLAALQTLQAGGKVYVHCAKGAHRGVAMGAAILIALGRSPQEAMQLIRQQRQSADPEAWYIRQRIYRFAEYWEKSSVADR
jgi:dual specificity MAP kinase phosphatase